MRWRSVGVRIAAVAWATALACGGRSERAAGGSDDDSTKGGGTAGAGATTSGRGGSTNGGSAPGGRGGTSGTGSSGNPSGGTTAGTGGSGGEAGAPAAGGEGGTPDGDCIAPSVRCNANGYRERCGTDGLWADDHFACTTALAGSADHSRVCAVKAGSGQITCFSFEPSPYLDQLVATFPEDHWVDVAVSDGDASMCALNQQGDLYCIEYPHSLVRHLRGPFVAAAISTMATCGLLSGGTLVCPEGSLQAPAGHFTQLSMAADRVVALRSDGTVFQLNGQPLPSGTYTGVHTSYFDACGIRTNGAIVCALPGGETAEIRGDEAYVEVAREFSDRVCARRTDRSVSCFVDATLTNAIEPPPGTYTTLEPYYDGFCGIHEDGTTECWSPTPQNALVPPPGW